MRDLMNIAENMKAPADLYIERAETELAPMAAHVDVMLGKPWDDANPNRVELEEITATEMRQGWGTKAMKLLCTLADEMDITLTLGVANETDGDYDYDADDDGDDGNDLPDEHTLIAWYEGFGFETVFGMTDRVMMKRTPG